MDNGANIEKRSGLLLGLATAGLLVGAAACSEGDPSIVEGGSDTAVNTTLSPQVQAELGAVCVDGSNFNPTLEEEFGPDQVGGPDSLMSSFTTEDEKGNIVPVSPEVFADELLDQVCHKPEVLAAITAFMLEPAGLTNGKITTPDSSSLDRVKELSELYRNNPEAAVEAIKTLASVVKAPEGTSLVDKTSEEKFSVIENKGTQIVPDTKKNGKVVGLKTQKITVGGLYTGYLFNYDQENLTEQELSDRETVRSLVLIGANGEMAIKVWIGDNQVGIEVKEDAPETTTVDTNVDQSDSTIDVAGTEPETDATDGENGNNDGPGPDDGSPEDNGCEQATHPGCEGGEEPGNPEPEETEPPTTPPPTTPPPTTPPPTTPPPTTPPPTTRPPTTPPPTTPPPTTPPPTTRPPTTTNPPTTTTPKGEQPGCEDDPNPYCIPFNDAEYDSNGMGGNSVPVTLLLGGGLLAAMHINGGFGKAREVFERLDNNRKGTR